jgi:ribosomal protein L30E
MAEEEEEDRVKNVDLVVELRRMKLMALKVNKIIIIKENIPSTVRDQLMLP